MLPEEAGSLGDGVGTREELSIQSPSQQPSPALLSVLPAE